MAVAVSAPPDEPLTVVAMLKAVPLRRLLADLARSLSPAYLLAMFRLPEITYPLSIDTIGKVLATGHEVTAHCNGCGRLHVRLNLVMLARRLGMYHLPHVYCAECRAAGRPDRNISLTLHAPVDPQSRWPRETSACQKARDGR